MTRKMKFKPVITRVKLNPEQAVVSCSCWDSGWSRFVSAEVGNNICSITKIGKRHLEVCIAVESAYVS